MLAGMVFGRKSRGGGHSTSANSDLLVTRVSGGKSREQLTIRIHDEVMRQLRWIVGDYVVLIAGDDSKKEWILQRVSGPGQNGLRITTGSGKTVKHGRVSFTLDRKVLDQVFTEGEKSFTATLCDSSGNSAVFLRD